MLVDLYLAVKPVLSVVDAIIGGGVRPSHRQPAVGLVLRRRPTAVDLFGDGDRGSRAHPTGSRREMDRRLRPER